MFDIGWSELLIVGVVALIAIGPKELPSVLRSVGQMMTKVRRMAAEFQGQFQEAMREAEMADLKKEVDKLNEQARNLNFDPLAEPAPINTPPPAPSGAQTDALAKPAEAVDAFSAPPEGTGTVSSAPTPEAHALAAEPEGGPASAEAAPQPERLGYPVDEAASEKAVEVPGAVTAGGRA